MAAVAQQQPASLRPYRAMWLADIAQDEAASARLHAAYLRQMKAEFAAGSADVSADTKAMWEGSCALRDRRDRCIEALRDCGGLLNLVPGEAS